MSNRRHSLVKLSKRLRILEDDLILFLLKNNIVETKNTHGVTGYDPEALKKFITQMDVFTRNEMFLLKTRWETEQEKQKQNYLEDYLSSEEISEFFNITVAKVHRFLTSNNVPRIMKNDVVFWDAKTVMRIQSSPSKKQYIELNKLKKSQAQESHLTNDELAQLFNVSVDKVNAFKKFLKIEHVYPFSRSDALDAISEYSFDAKKNKFLNKENRRIVKKSTPNVFEEKATETVLLLNGIPADKMFDTTQAAALIGVSVSGFRKFMKNGNVKPDGTYTNATKQPVSQYRYSTLYALQQDSRIKAMQLRSSRAKTRMQKRRDALENSKANITETIHNNMDVSIRTRRTPYSATLYVGPTNSGKTYTSLNQLFKEYEKFIFSSKSLNPENKFVYAGPLRMLAHEVYLKMVEKFGEENVGFLTGEEQINPEANLIAATTEMAPRSGESIVIDEAHWMIEPARGHNWTEILLESEYKTFHVLTAKEAVESIQKLVKDAYYVDVQQFTRKTPVFYRGVITPADVQPRTAVICFSRKMVYKIAENLQQRTNLKVGVLYGALPLMAREKQIQDYIDGKIDVIVTTDVIGHGINLPVDAVTYAETVKFDGQERRDLMLWEAAQISGRAGRFGLSEEGTITALNLGWNSDSLNHDLIKNSAKAAAGTLGTGLIVEEGLYAPKFPTLKVDKAENVMVAIEQWQKKAETLLTEHNVTPSEMREKKKILEAIATHLSTPIYPWDKQKDERNYAEGLKYGERKPIYPEGRALNAWSFKADKLWQLISGPFDPELETVTVVAEWLQNQQKDNSVELFSHQIIDSGVTVDDIEELERISRVLGELKMVSVIFEESKVNMVHLVEAEKIVGLKIIDVISQDVKVSPVGGSCVECGAECLSWFKFCDECHSHRFVFA